MSWTIVQITWFFAILSGFLIPRGKDERQRMLRYQFGNNTLVFLVIGLIVYGLININNTEFLNPVWFIVALSFILGAGVSWIYQKAKKLR